MQNEIINGVYNKSESSLLVKTNNVNNNMCYVYCSSNVLYQKDNQADSTNRIINNYFEWLKHCARIKLAEEIFIRDIWL